MKRTTFVWGMLLIATTALFIVSCKDSSTNSYGTTTTPPPAGSPHTVIMANMTFSPKSITVPKGTTVTWSNAETYSSHTATADTSTWDTGTVPGGASKAITFNTAGTYNYHCLYHGSMGMTGTVIVQ
jgi:plastocyanin